jgi:hypothetical protein
MNIPSRGKNHLFVGLVDKSKYKYDHLSKSLLTQCPHFGKTPLVLITGMFGTLKS